MTKEEKINVILSHLKAAEAQVRDGILLLNELLAEYDAGETFAEYRRSFFQVVHSTPKNNPDVGTPGNVEQGFVEFTQEEILTMPKKIQRLIILQKQRCRLRTRRCGNSYTYEIRLRRDGYNVTAGGKTIELAKANMLKKLAAAKPCEQERFPGETVVPLTFQAFAVYYFENFRKEKVAKKTYDVDFARCRKHLFPAFGEKHLNKITPADCKVLLSRIRTEGKGKTAEELHDLLSIIFKGAIAHGILERNPLDVVLRIKHESESGVALTKAEEKIMLDGLTEREYQIAAAIALFCGLRPNELATARIEGPFIVAVNSKRHSRKVEYKKIPICERLRRYLPETLPTLPTPQLLRRRLKALLPNHKLYDLRTTFYSRCKELGVATPALMEFAGHSLGVLGNAYTDLSDAYLLNEGMKLNKW